MVVLYHPLLDQLDSALSDLVQREPIEVVGEWTTARRRTYESESQLGTGSGPFADVVDMRWRGTLRAAVPIAGIAFLVTADSLYWAKAPEISLALPVDLSLHACAAGTPDRATFTGRLAGAYLPGVPVSVGASLGECCTVEERALTTGRVSCLGQATSAAVFVLLIQRELIEVGRKRIWRVRDQIASSVQAEMRELLTRRRTGTVRTVSG